MKILMVISEAPPIRSGVARVAEKLSQGLERRGNKVDILSLQDIPRREFGEFRFSTMPLKLSSLKERFTQYDIIHLHGPVPTFSDVFLVEGLRGLGKNRPKLVYTYHAPIDLQIFPLQPFVWAYNLAQEMLAQLADHVVATTAGYGNRLSRYVPAGKVSVIPWGVDYDRFVSPVQKDGPFTVVFLGQMRPYKGLPVLLKAAQGMKNMRVWVIGNGHTMEAYKRQAQELDLANVTFFGALSDDEVADRVKQAHAIVLPSVTRSEAFGIVLLEGMAAGLVPIASHLPGVAEVVGNEGFTFPPGNAGALRSILERLRDDQALRVHLAELAQKKARLYSWERVIFGYERVFAQLVQKQAVQSAIPGAASIPQTVKVPSRR